MLVWLQRNGFPDISKHTVDRLMRVAGMNGLVRGRRTTTTIRAKDKIRAKDLLNRNFYTDAPNKVWVTDFTYVPIRGGFAYVSFVIDLFSRRILSWASSTSHDTEFVEEALQLALWQRRNELKPHVRPVFGTVHHSDAGSEGGFNWSSQHPDPGGVQGWRRRTGGRKRATHLRECVGSGAPIAHCALRCGLPADRNRHGLCNASSGA